MRKNKLLNHIDATYPGCFDICTEDPIHTMCTTDTVSALKNNNPSDLLPIQLASNLAYYQRDRFINLMKRIKVSITTFFLLIILY